MYKLIRFSRAVSVLCIHVAVLTLVLPGAALAKDPKPLGWENVLKLRSGDRITVTLMSKQVQTGKVSRVEPTSIAMTTKEGELLIPREDIRAVGYMGKPKIATPGAWLMIGGAGLAGAALLGGTLKDTNDLSSGKMSSGSTGTGLAIAGVTVAAAGAAIMILGGKPKLIYEHK
jgi:hypothetical protein